MEFREPISFESVLDIALIDEKNDGSMKLLMLLSVPVDNALVSLPVSVDLIGLVVVQERTAATGSFIWCEKKERFSLTFSGARKEGGVFWLSRVMELVPL